MDNKHNSDTPTSPDTPPQIAGHTQPSESTAVASPQPLIEELHSPRRLFFMHLTIKTFIILGLVAIFWYGMTVPQTEEGVNQVAEILGALSIPAVLYLTITFARSEHSKLFGKHLNHQGSTQQSISGQNQRTEYGLRNMINILIRVLLVIVIMRFSLFSPIIFIAAIPIILSLIAYTQKNSGKEPSKFLKIATLISMTLLTFASFSFVVIIGVFALSVRACELSSSKCY